MRAARILRAGAAAGLLPLLAGCGTTGSTSIFAVPLDPGAPVAAAGKLAVASVTMDEDAPRLFPVGNVREWGRFDGEDLAHLGQSLATTLAAASGERPAGPAPPGSGYDVHLRVRRYVLGISNTGGAVLACVAWAVAAPDGTIAFSEQFYATREERYFGTVGGLKDRVDGAIVRRVATMALHVAADPVAEPPADFAGTYATLGEAIASLPATLEARGDPAAMASGNAAVGIAGALAVTAIGAIPWRQGGPPDDVDWAAELR